MHTLLPVTSIRSQCLPRDTWCFWQFCLEKAGYIRYWLNTPCVWTLVLLLNTLWIRHYCYPHFTEQDIEAWSLEDLPTVRQISSKRAAWLPGLSSQSWHSSTFGVNPVETPCLGCTLERSVLRVRITHTWWPRLSCLDAVGEPVWVPDASLSCQLLASMPRKAAQNGPRAWVPAPT